MGFTKLSGGFRVALLEGIVYERLCDLLRELNMVGEMVLDKVEHDLG